jgi:CheY-like chemotaxis protein
VQKSEKRIYIVEDDHLIQSFLESLLAETGCLITKFDNAFDALEATLLNPPDVMTLDLNLNVKNSITGYELPRILHNRYKMFFPIVVISGDSPSFQDPARLDYSHTSMVKIKKPFDPEYIKILIKKILC